MDLNTILVVSGLTLPFFLLTCWALVHVATRDFGTVYRKAAWGAVAFIPFIGPIIYIFFGMRQGKKR